MAGQRRAEAATMITAQVVTLTRASDIYVEGYLFIHFRIEITKRTLQAFRCDAMQKQKQNTPEQTPHTHCAHMHICTYAFMKSTHIHTLDSLKQKKRIAQKRAI